MNPLRQIRTNVFRITQAEMAGIAATTQATVSRWESDELTPSIEHLRRIRDEAVRRGLLWEDAYFFAGKLAA